MSKKGQIFYRESKLKFYLRNSHSTHPCQIYLVASIDGKRYRIYTKMKVYASQWDQERQLAVISNVQSKQDNRNNKIANNYLNKLRGYFSEFIEYICNNNVDDIAETLKKFINRDMAKKKINLVYVAADALEYYHNYVKPSIKDSTKRQSESLLSEFGRFVDTLREKDKTMQIFSQRGLNMYKEYLIDKMNKSKDDDSMRNFGVGQLNRCGAIIALLINKVLVPQEKAPSPVVWIKVDDPRREDQMGHIPLLDNEVAAIESCSGLTPVEEEYRDVFLLHLECGQRVSDLAKLLTGNYKVKQGKKYKYIVVSTTKENINAIIPITPKVTMLMDKIKNHTLVDPKEFEEKTKGKGNNTYNEAIRRIAKKAGLDREIVKIDSTQKEVRKPLYKTVSSHDARCTFITNMIKKGVSPERLCRMTGHANDEMIKRVYAQLTVEDEINRIESDLYSDVDDDDTTDQLVNSSSNKPNELTTAITNEHPVEEFVATSSKVVVSDSIPTPHFDRNSYIKGLEEAVNTSLAQIEAWQDGISFDDSMVEEYKSKLDKAYLDYKEQIEDEALDSEDDIIEWWHQYEEYFDGEDSKQPESCQGFMDIYKIAFLNALTDYCKEKQLGNNLLKRIEGFKNEIYDGNPILNLINMALSSINIIIPFISFFSAIAAAIQYAVYNRPVIGHLLKNEDYGTLIRIPNWNLVYQELHKFPALRLEAMIQKTDCPNDIKITLYKSITSGDVTLFANTINSYYRESSEMIELAYVMDFINKTMELCNQRLNPERELFSPLDEMADLQDFFASQNPFEEFDFGIFTLAESNAEEQAMFIMDQGFGMLEELKKIAYPLERKIYNKILGCISQYPELEKAYSKYKSRNHSVSNSDGVVALIDSSEDEGENRKDASSKVNYLPVSIQNLDIDKFIRLLTEKDKLNKYKQFITVLESTDNVNVATCLKHFLGTASNTPLSFTLKWNGNSMVSLKFLIRLIVNPNEDAKKDDVINKSKFDGISKNVSKWKGAGDLWTPVYNVFEGCTSSIFTAALGAEGTDARVINLNELETIADIYFECKKK